MKIFPALNPLELVAINILVELVTTPRINEYLLHISDSFSKLVRTALLDSITAAYVAKAFLAYCVMAYAPPRILLSDIAEQFILQFFRHVCKPLGIENLLTITCHPQTSGQIKRYNRTTISWLRHYVDQHSKHWELYTDILTF